MKIIDLKLGIKYDEISLIKPEKLPEFTGYIINNTEGYNKDVKRPAVIICPGGGYAYTSSREAEPIALKYLSEDISAFVLRYSCAPSVYPTSLVELATAVKIVRENAEKWNIDANKIIVLGASAGGHLVGCLNVFWNGEVLRSRGFSDELHKPNGTILLYPAISTTQITSEHSCETLLGEQDNEENRKSVSLELHVTKDAVKSFIWHTFEDNIVSVQNSLLFASALAEKNIQIELHIYPKGVHGLSLGTDIVNPKENVVKNIDSWFNFSVDWVKEVLTN